MKSTKILGFRVDLFWAYGALGIEVSRPKGWRSYWVYSAGTVWPPIKRYRANVSTHT